MLGYTTLGNGDQKVLLFHDYTSDCKSYDTMHPYMDLEHFTYVFADLRGYGKSQQILGQYTLDEFLKDTEELVDHLGWKAFHLVGHSMSGMFTQYYVLHHQDQILSLITITPTPACGWKVDPETKAFIENTVKDRDCMQQLLHGMTQGRLGDLWAKNKVNGWFDIAEREACLGYMNIINSEDFSDKVQGIETPILVIVGDCDHPELGEEVMRNTFLNYYPNAKIEVVKNAGHYPMNETPIYLANLMTKFWTSVVSPALAQA